MSRRISCLFLALVLGTFTERVFAGYVSNTLGSSVQAYFGYNGDAAQLNDGGAASWPAVTAAASPWAGYTSLPSVPSPSTGAPPTGPFPFTGGGRTSTFASGSDSATSTIQGSFNTAPNSPDGGVINLSMNLKQSAPSYSYEQVNFDIDYDVTGSAGNMSLGLVGSTVYRSFQISGTVQPGGFATFGGHMDFWSVPAPYTGLGAFLGTIPISFNINNPGASPLTFGPTTITGSAYINGPVDPPDHMRITGSYFLIADPSDITVVSVPEPSSVVMLAMAGLGLLGVAWRRRRAVATV